MSRKADHYLPQVQDVDYADLDAAVAGALEWLANHPRGDAVDAAFAIACRDTTWGIQPAWSQLLAAVKALAV